MKSLTGHINQREDKPRSKCRVWELVVNLPRKGNRYPTKTRAFHGTYTQAQSALRDFIREIESGIKPPSKMTLGKYLDAWQTKREESKTVADRTLSRDKGRIRTINMHLADYELSELTRKDIEGFYTSLLKGETPSGRPYSPKTLDNIHRTLSSALNAAVRDGLIASNPCNGAKRPKVPQVKRDTPSTESIDSLLGQLDVSQPVQLAVFLIAAFGFRSSEALALDWSDWDGHCMSVTKAAEENGDVKPTKSTHIREVPAPQRVADVLSRIKSEGRIAPIFQSYLMHWWAKHRDEFGMQGVTLHEMRHAYATRLALAKVHPRAMMQLGGWDTIDVCMRIYTHVNNDLSADVERAFAV